MLIQHYHPLPLPSIDDAKSPQITVEVSKTCHCYRDEIVMTHPQIITLYKRILNVLPDYGKGKESNDITDDVI